MHKEWVCKKLGVRTEPKHYRAKGKMNTFLDWRKGRTAPKMSRAIRVATRSAVSKMERDFRPRPVLVREARIRPKVVKQVAPSPLQDEVIPSWATLVAEFKDVRVPDRAKRRAKQEREKQAKSKLTMHAKSGMHKEWVCKKLDVRTEPKHYRAKGKMNTFLDWRKG